MSVTGQDVILWVTTSDDNSGVSRVIISEDDVCDAGDARRDVTQSTQEFGWTLQNSGEVYICAEDRAGNISSPPAFVQGEADNTIFLPLVVRNLGGQ